MADKIYKSKIGGEVSPVVPTATEPTHAVPLSQVRDLIGNKKSPLTNVSGAVNLDVSLYGVFDLTLTAATDFTFINIPTDSTRPVTIYLTGAFAWTLAQGTEEASSDAYDGAINNRVQVDIVSGTKIFYQIQNL